MSPAVDECATGFRVPIWLRSQAEVRFDIGSAWVSEPKCRRQTTPNECRNRFGQPGVVWSNFPTSEPGSIAVSASLSATAVLGVG